MSLKSTVVYIKHHKRIILTLYANIAHNEQAYIVKNSKDGSCKYVPFIQVVWC